MIENEHNYAVGGAIDVPIVMKLAEGGNKRGNKADKRKHRIG